MSTTLQAQQEQLASLRRYTSYLMERNAALGELLRCSESLRSNLNNNQSTNIDTILDQRERDCRKFGELNTLENKTDALNFEALRTNGIYASEEHRTLVNNAADLRAYSQSLTQNIMLLQSECEAIMKERLQATALALRESVHRRKLDAAYGPAFANRSPVFLDKQQ